ncbi:MULTISPECIES: CoA ester lyase [unclassified Bradyrhizobium]|uniref:HpcH/HpaI aldolase/citrate lyase family protein n=1 Tax=unclassified Bradyrhizobium TaxID=2631580 RepID=UPI0015CB0521|nr:MULTISPECIES: CoA ester lyase [unclassified Bradyrhizobium]MBB4260525.1 citrate lyase subunit beta/citryl-CoA lyase [Bradyrhizobium sp. CIR3A]NYG46795.1 citrate lyase subunit beta/citryl-CoA lyase [Bradyrhizobium sp. IAR9]
MDNTRPRRSALYMPASNSRAIEKARSLSCDVVILDLEDAVAPDMKVAAREQAVAAVKEGGFGRRELVVRINGLDTPWGRDDLAAVAAIGADAVLAPKVSAAGDVIAYDGPLSGRTRLWIMVETCQALFHLGEIAETAARTRLAAFVSGTNDLAKEMRCRPDVVRLPLLAPLSLTVAAARAHALVVLDGVFNAIEDEAGCRSQCRQAVELGFDGKTLIHPSQVAIANSVFAPSKEEVAWAHVVVAAFAAPDAAEKGVLRVDGRMVERLHLDQARQVIAVADAIAEAGAA